MRGRNRRASIVTMPICHRARCAGGWAWRRLGVRMLAKGIDASAAGADGESNLERGVLAVQQALRARGAVPPLGTAALLSLHVAPNAPEVFTEAEEWALLGSAYRRQGKHAAALKAFGRWARLGLVGHAGDTEGVLPQMQLNQRAGDGEIGSSDDPDPASPVPSVSCAADAGWTKGARGGGTAVLGAGGTTCAID